MIRASISGGWIAMPWDRNFSTHLLNTVHHCVEIIHLEPKQHTIAIGLVIGIANRAVVVLNLEVVQLKHKALIVDQALVFGAAMRASASEQALIPETARLDVVHGDEWLWTHIASNFPSSYTLAERRTR
jgi:hypothetical protein